MKAVTVTDHLMNTSMNSTVEEWVKTLKEADIPNVGRSATAFIAVLLNLIIPNKIIVSLIVPRIANKAIEILPDRQYEFLNYDKETDTHNIKFVNCKFLYDKLLRFCLIYTALPRKTESFFLSI